ncbi:phosphocholine-specific phospholipase C [Mucilaginibacter sp. KACC 22063]|uniref:phosphocholine-specific phospholipase C n=1 Tax=Mucilaginibacter sp. KACC 22063 TaxID=3025666 RepID=UPI002365E8D9|nr:phospholipase C, phosphocholine-specific [Mucilaginibacter sp. KACC 22063]WDF56681.1 phospholipase C, phosphocholine-specific [Mucilaginibacter sp. KACC 22063]
MKDTRRDFIKKAALLTGAASLSTVLPASIQKALAIDPVKGSTYLDAEHIVILMQENRSFDHVYGTLRGVRGYNDPRIIDLPNKNKVWLQSNAEGETYAPFHLDIKDTKATWMNSLPHSWANQVNARNDGKYDQWLNVKKNSHPEYSKMPLTLGYHTREDIPFYYALADAFTVCDQNFCSALTGTNPNRLFFWTGTIRDQQNEDSRALVWNDDMDYGTLKWKTYPERLEENGVSWKCYQNEMSIDVGFQGEEDSWLSNFQDNPLEFFGQYNIHLHKKHVETLKARLASLPTEIDALKKQIAALPAGDAHIDHLTKQLNQKQSDLDNIKKNDHLLDPAAFEKLSQHQKNIHNKAFSTNTADPHYHDLIELTYDDNGTERKMQVPKGDVLYQFREDVRTGKLPTVSWVTAPENFSDHPSAPWYGAWYVSEVLDILTKNPEVWKKTIFILAYDENDGYFDHVPPFVAPHSHKTGTGKVSSGMDTRVEYVTLEQEHARNGFPTKYDRECSIGLGYRVPLVVASPWSRGGWVNSEVFDHTSTLQFLEKFLKHKTGKNITEDNISDWRRTICGDLTSVFRPYNGEAIAQPKFVVKDAFLESIHKAKFKGLPSGYKALNQEEIALFNKAPNASPYMAKQESGIRESCALPYELHVDGGLSADKKSFEVSFKAGNTLFGPNSAGAPFNVYAPGKYVHMDDSSKFDDLRTWSYGVKAGDQLSDVWPLHEFENGLYHLRIYGPNGFYREFKGDKNDPALNIKANYQKSSSNSKKLSGNIELHIANNGQHEYQVKVANAYGAGMQTLSVKPEEKRMMIVDLSKYHQWYDLNVTVAGHQQFEKRFAGRVETGNHSYSDPLMGGTLV